MKSADAGFWDALDIRHVVSFALILRTTVFVASLLVTGGTIGFQNPDSDSYVEPATALLTSGAYALHGHPDITRTPGYPLLLVPGVALGHVEIVTIVLQIFISTLTVYVVYRIGLELFAERRTALYGAAAYAIEPVSILFTVKIVSETLFTALLALGLYFLIRYVKVPAWRSLLLAAFLIAAATYVRPISYYLPVFVALIIVSRTAFDRAAWRKHLIHGGGFLLVAMGLTSLWQVRNYTRTGYSGFSAYVEFNLYYYEAAQVLAVAEGVPFGEMAVRFGLDDEWRYEKYPDELRGRRGQRYQDMGRTALRILREHPRIYAETRVKAIMRTAVNPGGFEYMILYQVYPGWKEMAVSPVDRGLIAAAMYFLRDRPALFWTNIGLAVVLALFYFFGGISVLTGRAFARPWALLFFAVMAYFLVLSLGSSRFRHPIMPIVAVFAGHGISVAVEWHRRKRRNRVGEGESLHSDPEISPS